MKIITQKEAAAMMRKSEATLARLRRDGELRYIPGRPIRFHLSEIERYLDKAQIKKTRPRKSKGKGPWTPQQRALLDRLKHQR